MLYVLYAAHADGDFAFARRLKSRLSPDGRCLPIGDKECRESHECPAVVEYRGIRLWSAGNHDQLRRSWKARFIMV